MNLRDILTIYDYNYWATRRILAATAEVSPEQFVAPGGSSFGSLRGTLVHTLDSEQAWRMLLQHSTLDYFHTLDEKDFPTLDILEQRWREQELAMRDYLVHLSDAELIGVIRYTTPENENRERVLWHCLYHIVNHGTQHRSEVAALLTDFGYSPGGLDFTAFLNEQAASPT